MFASGSSGNRTFRCLLNLKIYKYNGRDIEEKTSGTY